MDAFDLFKKLGAGAKFDFKRFRSDAEKLHVILLSFGLVSSLKLFLN